MRRQSKDSRQRMSSSGGVGSSSIASEPVVASLPPSLEGQFPPSTMVVSTPSSAASRSSFQQYQERYTFYSPNAQQPLVSHMPIPSSSEDIGFYASDADIPGSHSSTPPLSQQQQQQQQQQQLRLPPFSTLVPHQEQVGTSVAGDPAMAMTSRRTGEISRVSLTPSAFTPTRPVPLSSSMTSTSGSSSTPAVHNEGPRPGSAGIPPIPFFFHHPEYGIEACMRQLSSHFERTQTAHR
ncbi:hypothetical protein BX666DRAFT_1961316 [Dichotomocladium elegans]|nr:hypothetical protein BX666DRAFT_1961316 [Dichotomocladium elegans]